MNIHTIKVGFLEVNCYVVTVKSNDCFIIDPGNDAKNILSYLKDSGLTPSKILLTHGHFDHVEAVTAIKNKFPDVLVYVHADDVEFLVNNERWENYLGRPMVSASYDKLIKDGDVINHEGEDLLVIETPGHSQGSVCFLAENDMFTGDTLFASGGIGRTDLWNSSPAAMRTSLKRLFSIEKSVAIYPGHGPASTLAKERTRWG